MAVIRFYPTWIASVVHDEIGDTHYSYNYPLELCGAGPITMGFVGFNMAEIGRVLNLYYAGYKYLAIQSPLSTFPERYLSLVLHSNAAPPSETNPITTGPTSVNSEGIVEGGYIKVDLDLSLVVAGPTGSIWLGLAEAINRGYQGFRIDSYTFDLPSTNEVFIELDGNFDNPRPTPTRPVGGEVQNLQETIRFRWNHNSLLNQESFELRYRVTGSSSWTTVQEDTNNSYYDLPPNTLTTNEYEWQVRTTSEYDFVSPWSLAQVFYAAHLPPSPVFMTPIEGETIGISDLHIEWDSIDQDRYEFELLDSDNNIIWSVAKLSTSQEISIDNILENNQSYTLRLRVGQSGSLASSWTEINISVDYTAPALPILTLTPDKETGSIEVDIHNPPLTGTEPTPTHQELFRRKEGEQWIKLANLLPNSKYVDYTPASGKTYDYRVIVYGNNDTSSISNIFSGSVEVKYSQLNLTSDLSEIVTLMFNPSISFSKNYSVTTKSFAGRKKPVAEFGELINQSGAMDFVVDDNTLNRLYEFLERQETLLFRDSRGKKMFIVISDINVNYHSARMHGSPLYEISLSLTEVYYDEVII